MRRLHQTKVRVESIPELAAEWLGQIRASFSALASIALPRSFFSDDERLEISLLSPGCQSITAHKNLSMLWEERCETDRPISHLVASLAADQPKVAVIHATPGCALRKAITLPASIHNRQLRQSLEYLLEVETPFRRDQVYWGFRAGPRRRGGKRTIDLVVVPKSAVDPHAETLRENGIHLRELRYREDVASEAPISLVRYPAQRERQGRRLLLALGIVAFLQVVAAAAIPLVAHTVEASRLDEETTRLSTIAADLGGLQSSLEKAMQPVHQAQLELQSSPSSAAVLRILEAELGKDTVLDRLSVRGALVQATGSTPRVDDLTVRLEKSQYLKPKSITRNGVNAAGQELFSVALELTSGEGR